MPVVYAHDAVTGQDRLVQVFEERSHVQGPALRVLRVQARDTRRVEGVPLIRLPHLEDGGAVLPESHHAALLRTVATEPIQLLGLHRAPSGLLEELFCSRSRGWR